VFVARRISEPALERLAAETDADIWPDDLPPTRAQLLERVAGVAGLLSMVTERVDDELLDAAGNNLKVVSQFGVGVDNIDVPACTRRAVAVGNTPGILTETTADGAFALLMASARRVTEGYAYVRDDRWKAWSPTVFLGADIHHATLGIVGFGRIGREVAARARGFAMRILYSSRHAAADEQGAQRVDLDQLLRESDFVSLHVPLTPETHHLINAEALRKMKPSAILINTARGPVVDPDALYDALKSGTIAGAALDVTEPEPMPGTHKLLSLPNCLVVPHIGSASVATRAAMSRISVDNLLAGVRGDRLPACVNPSVFERA
jgi:lactate dehydrogenase-like 2-hydroxyacid dehydrogenase